MRKEYLSRDPGNEGNAGFLSQGDNRERKAPQSKAHLPGLKNNREISVARPERGRKMERQGQIMTDRPVRS